MKTLDKRRLKRLDIAQFPKVIETSQVTDRAIETQEGVLKSGYPLRFAYTAYVTRKLGGHVLVIRDWLCLFTPSRMPLSSHISNDVSG